MRFLLFLRLVLLSALAVFGCGDDLPAVVVDSAPWPMCNPTPGFVSFRLETCVGYGDVGTCRWLYADGRDVQWSHCWTQAGTCLASCDEVKP